MRSPTIASAAAICALAIGVDSCVEFGIGEVTEVADRRDAVARQHVERVGEIGAAVLARVGGIGDCVAQPVERELEGRVGHGDLALARASQEIRDVGVEPDVVAADAPQAKRAVCILPREQRLDGVANPLIGRWIDATCASLARSLT